MVTEKGLSLRFIPWMAILTTTITIVGSCMTGKTIAATGFESFLHLDKIAHFLAYTSQGLFWILWKKKNVLKVFLGLFLLGISLEFIQFYLLEDRFYEIFDIIANTLGVIAGISGGKWLLNHYFLK